MHAVPPYFPAWLSHTDPRPLTQVLRKFPRFASRTQLRDTFAVLVRLLAPTADSLKDALRLLLLFFVSLLHYTQVLQKKQPLISENFRISQGHLLLSR